MILLLGGEFAALWPRVRAGEFDRGDGDGKPFREEVRGLLRGLVLETPEDHDAGDGHPREAGGGVAGQRSRSSWPAAGGRG
jgi:hypothetical protein